MIVHVVDGTYELFRHFYGLRRFNDGKDSRFGAVIGVLQTLLQMLEGGATHIGVATDHVIESFRNHLWPDYKTGDGIERALLGERRKLTLLFKNLATLRTDAALFRDVDELRWRGPASAFASWTERMQAPRLFERSLGAQKALEEDRGSPQPRRLRK